jgi:hypothetical protein
MFLSRLLNWSLDFLPLFRDDEVLHALVKVSSLIFVFCAVRKGSIVTFPFVAL